MEADSCVGATHLGVRVTEERGELSRGLRWRGVDRGRKSTRGERLTVTASPECDEEMGGDLSVPRAASRDERAELRGGCEGARSAVSSVALRRGVGWSASPPRLPPRPDRPTTAGIVHL